MQLVPGEPAELVFQILPISMIFKAGHKIQLVISFQEGNPRLNPPPEVTITVMQLINIFNIADY